MLKTFAVTLALAIIFSCSQANAEQVNKPIFDNDTSTFVMEFNHEASILSYFMIKPDIMLVNTDELGNSYTFKLDVETEDVGGIIVESTDKTITSIMLIADNEKDCRQFFQAMGRALGMTNKEINARLNFPKEETNFQFWCEDAQRYIQVSAIGNKNAYLMVVKGYVAVVTAAV